MCSLACVIVNKSNCIIYWDCIGLGKKSHTGFKIRAFKVWKVKHKNPTFTGILINLVSLIYFSDLLFLETDFVLNLLAHSHLF